MIGDGERITIGEALARATAALRAQRTETARLDGEVLLAHVMARSRASLLAHGDEPLPPRERAAFEGLIARRARGEPVAHLTGQRDWYDLSLRITPAVLTPRPETEGLLERALAWARGRQIHVAVDVGTGSGALAIALARVLVLPASHVYATDISPDALAVARDNAGAVGVADAITFVRGDLLAAVPGPIDLIVANLPYIGAEEYRGLQRDVRLYEPRLALVGGAQGHELLARLLHEATTRLAAGGAIFAELGPPQADPAASAARYAFPTAEVRLERDDAGLLRYLTVLT